MRFRKPISFVLFLVLIAAFFTVPAFAADKTDDAGTKWNIYFKPGVRFGTESRVLYIMDFLIPLYQDEKNIFFSNIKYTPNDRDGWELNVGAGYRRLLWEEKLLLGLNAYYDKRKTDWGTNHEQWGVGLEAMVDIPLEPFNLGLTGRFNYYYPLSHTRIDGLGTPYATYVLSDSGIILNGGRVEEPMRGFDYEAGVRIPYISDYVETWTYAGGYHYKGRRVRDINGFMARLEVIPTDFMRLNYEFHYDNYEKGEHYGEVTFEVPFSVGNLVSGRNPFEGIGDVFTGSRDLKERMVEPVRRDVDVKVMVDEENDNILSGGEEIEDVVFVSETGSDATGDGTIKNPYATISYALANDSRILSGACKTIHVMNSSTAAVIADNPTLDIANFLLWGSGANHPTHPVSNMPYSGHPTINDALTLNAPNPYVTGLGFDVAGSEYCIDILNSTGVRIKNNTFFMSRAGNAYGIRSAIAADIGTEGNPILIAKNSFDIESTGGNAYGIRLRTTGDIFATITGNDMSNTITGDDNAYGVRLSSTGGSIGSETRPVIISSNPMSVTSNDIANGIYLDADQNIFASITGNDMSNTIWGNSFADSIHIDSDNGGIGSAARPVIISGNLMNVVANINDAYGILFHYENSAYLNVTKNVISVEANDETYGLYTLSNSSLLLKFAGNDMTLKSLNNYVRALHLDVDNGDFGAANNPIVIKDNRFTLEAAASVSSVLYMFMDTGHEDVYLRAFDNSITFTRTGGGRIRAFYFDAASWSPGNIGFYPNYPVIISGNSARFYGGNNVFIHANTANNDNYNYLIWGGNSLYNTGTWGGNYGPNNEVRHNFTGSDVISP